MCISYNCNFILGFLLLAMSKEAESLPYQNLFKVRTVTAFIRFEASDFEVSEDAKYEKLPFRQKLDQCSQLLNAAQKELTGQGYDVQTVRIATNSFGEWACDVSSGSASNGIVLKDRLNLLDECLDEHDITFCALGPARNVREIELCPAIVEVSPHFSCSANIEGMYTSKAMTTCTFYSVHFELMFSLSVVIIALRTSACDVQCAKAAAEAILKISTLGEGDPYSFLANGLGNFRFCAAASCCVPFIPFFPAAKCDSNALGLSFALGLENGSLARAILSKCDGLEEVKSVLKQEFTTALSPLESICTKVASKCSFPTEYLGIDSSFNPSLEDEGSVAAAIEQLKEVSCFGGVGTLAAAAAITTSIQSLPIKLSGYCGLMLPVLEDQRLSELASETPSKLKISQLLSISSVCGVGIDTVPIPGKCSVDSLSSLILDMAGLAARWNKSLSCRGEWNVANCMRRTLLYHVLRLYGLPIVLIYTYSLFSLIVFPMPDGDVGSVTNFDSPYMCNSRVFDVN